MEFTSSKNNISWDYEIKGEGKPVLFLHPWSVDKRVWRQQIKFFSEHFQVIVVDLPGHGKTTWECVSIVDMADDLTELLAHHQIHEFATVGSSMGGLVSLAIYGLFPDKLKFMAFVGSTPKFAKSKDFPYGIDVKRIRKLHSQVNDNYPSIVDVFFRSLFTRNERSTRRFKWMQRFRKHEGTPMKQALGEYLDILEHVDLRDTLKAVNIPMQFINGREDEICTIETVEYIQQMRPDARYDIFDQCGHFPFLSKPYEFNEVLFDFLKEYKEED